MVAFCIKYFLRFVLKWKQYRKYRKCQGNDFTESPIVEKIATASLPLAHITEINKNKYLMLAELKGRHFTVNEQKSFKLSGTY